VCALHYLPQFPVEVRSTLNGASAALGKLGAFIGASAFPTFVDLYGYPTVFFMCSGTALLGMLTTVLFVDDTRGQHLLIGEPLGVARTSRRQTSSESDTGSQHSHPDMPWS
jgi:hypothetical protein